MSETTATEQPTKLAKTDEQADAGTAAAAATTTDNAELDTATAAQVKTQCEFYFGDANFVRDKFLRATADANDGFVPIATLLTFNRLRALTTSEAAVAACLAESDAVELNEDRTAVRRRAAAPTAADLDARAIFTRTYPADATWEAIGAFWTEKVGPVAATRLHRKKGEKEPTGSAFVEFEDAESAQKAIALAAEGTLKFREEDEKPLEVMAKKSAKEQKKEKKAAVKKANEGKKSDKADDELHYTKGCIVALKGIGVIEDRMALKSALEPFGDVEYIDYPNEAVEGFARFADPDAAQAALDAFAGGKREIFGKVPTLGLVEGDEERAYWQRIVDNGKLKKANRRNSFRGGRKRRRN